MHQKDIENTLYSNILSLKEYLLEALVKFEHDLCMVDRKIILSRLEIVDFGCRYYDTNHCKIILDPEIRKSLPKDLINDIIERCLQL